MTSECATLMPSTNRPACESSNAPSNAPSNAHKQSVWHNHVRTYVRTYRDLHSREISLSHLRDAHEFEPDFLGGVSANA